MTSLDKAILIMQGGADSGKSLPLGAGTTTFGRQSGNNVVVDELGVSQQHAEISTEVDC